MPKERTQIAKPAATVAQAEQRQIVYPFPRTMICAGEGIEFIPYGGQAEVQFNALAKLTPEEKKALGLISRPAVTVDQMKFLLGWKTEEDYSKELMADLIVAGKDPEKHDLKFPDADKPNISEEQRLKIIKNGSPVIFKDEYGSRVVCWHNSRNRPFDENHARKLAQDYLNGHWCLNLENFIFGKTGLCLSGQHRGIGFILADQMRERDDHWKKLWPNPLTLDTAMAFGCDEADATVSTLDNTKPRSDGDVVYTSSHFRDMSNYDRKECGRMMEKATKFMWARTGAGKRAFHEYQTHSESQDFRDRHKKLFDCVKHLFENNQDRQVTDNGVSAGEAAGICYLMASAKSDWTKYVGTEQPDETLLDFSLLNKAYKFWTDFAKGLLGPLVAAMGSAKNELEQVTTWQQVILAKAWGLYSVGTALTVDNLQPMTTSEEVESKHEDGTPYKYVVKHLDEWPGFGGIDQGPKKPEAPEPNAEPDAEETLEAKKVAARKQSAEELKARIEAAKQAKLNKGSTVNTPASAASSAPVKGGATAVPAKMTTNGTKTNGSKKPATAAKPKLVARK